ncbi:MAG: hypothetical protein AB7G47_17980 [Mycolicibacterium sp.]|uniref:hypothetical protein n=1 Tax=Mycolicibacterium sp. TaxID=2320850 RepID=UPI003D1234DD
MSEFHADEGSAGRHSEVPPELRLLAESILGRLDPVVRLLASRVQAAGSGKCEQVWCPVCAGIALISGEQHPLLDTVAEHSVGLLTVVKAMLDNLDGAGAPSKSPGQTPDDASASEPAEPGGPAGPPGSAEPKDPGRYQHITVIIDE